VIKAIFYHDPKFHLPVNYIIPMAAIGIPKERMEAWDWYQFNNYIKLKEDADANALQAKFKIIHNHSLKEKVLYYNLSSSLCSISIYCQLTLSMTML
jgi:putative ABC transport system permease protein